MAWKDGKYSVRCTDRATTLSPLGNEARDKILASATFHGPLWQHEAYSLARDSQGRYYYVDRRRASANNKTFRPPINQTRIAIYRLSLLSQRG